MSWHSGISSLFDTIIWLCICSPFHCLCHMATRICFVSSGTQGCVKVSVSTVVGKDMSSGAGIGGDTFSCISPSVLNSWVSQSSSWRLHCACVHTFTADSISVSGVLLCERSLRRITLARSLSCCVSQRVSAFNCWWLFDSSMLNHSLMPSISTSEGSASVFSLLLLGFSSCGFLMHLM